MVKKETITINKNDLWKYSTLFLLGFVVIFFGISYLGGHSNPSVKINNSGNPTVDTSVLNNPSLFPSLGPNNAKHIVIEFSDFQCPYCAMASGLPNWTAQYSTGKYSDLYGLAGKLEKRAEEGKLKFIYVPMSFLGEESVLAAEAGLCANKQGKFWSMHDALFTANDGKERDGTFTKTNLKTIAGNINGLNTTEFNNCLENDVELTNVKKIATIASKFTTGTPTFYVDGTKIPAAWSQISSLLN